MPGPSPKHPSVRARRNDPKKDFRVLSPEGLAGEVPEWPLAADVASTAQLEVQRDKMAGLQVEIEQTEDGRTRGRLQRQLDKLELATAQLALEVEQAADAERALWEFLWAMPQAVMWKEAHAHREVAQYVRWKIRAESGNLDAGKEARMLSDRLGLNPLALLRLRAEVQQVSKAEDDAKRRRAKDQESGADEESGDGEGTGGDQGAGDDEPDDPRSFLSAVK